MMEEKAFPSFSKEKYLKTYGADYDSDDMTPKEIIPLLSFKTCGITDKYPLCIELIEKDKRHDENIKDEYRANGIKSILGLKHAFYYIDVIFKDELNDNIFSKMPYNKFLETDYWKIVSKYKRYISNNECRMCGSENVELHIHHKSYIHRGQEHYYCHDDKELICLCAGCHKKLHKG